MSYTNISGKRSHRFPLMGDCGCGCAGTGGCGDDAAPEAAPKNDKVKKAVIYGGGALLFLWVLGRSDPRRMPS